MPDDSREARIAEIKEDVETQIMGKEDKYTHDVAAFLENQKHVAEVRHAEVLREVKMKHMMGYYERIKVARSYMPPYKTIDKMQERINSLFEEKTAYLARPEMIAIRDQLRAEAYVRWPRSRRLEQHAAAKGEMEKLPCWDRVREIMQESSKLRKEMREFDPDVKRTSESEEEINHELKTMLQESRRMSPTLDVRWVANEEYERVDNALKRFKSNRGRKTKEEAEEMKRCIDYLKDPGNKPTLDVIRAKPHKVGVVLPPPKKPDHSWLLKNQEVQIRAILDQKIKRVLVDKMPAPRTDNLVRLINETGDSDETVEVRIPNAYAKTRYALLLKADKISKAKKGKCEVPPTKEPQQQWKMKSQLGLKHLPTEGLERGDPLKKHIQSIYVASAVRGLLDSARRDLLHSGKRPSIQSLQFSNQTASSLASVMVDKEARHYLRMYLPNNVANKICSRRAELIRQKFSC